MIAKGMNLIKICLLTILLIVTSGAYSANSDCCHGMDGIHYCDSSAGRFVCKNGYYSSCYCTRRAVMDLQLFKGCCMWQGGVLAADTGIVVCNNGSVSEACSLQTPNKDGLTDFK
jgi:hypothetical protein